MSVNSAACVSATGATCAAAPPSSTKKRSSSVSGSDRLSMTGVSERRNGFSASIDEFSAVPRPAKASPKPSVAPWIAGRVSRSKVEKTSSYSSGSDARATGTVSPSFQVASASPGISSTYLRPSAERGRTLTRVSRASGSICLSRLRWATAMLRRSPSTVATPGSMSSTTPTRKPPTRTSLPGTSFAPEGSSVFSL